MHALRRSSFSSLAVLLALGCGGPRAADPTRPDASPSPAAPTEATVQAPGPASADPATSGAAASASAAPDASATSAPEAPLKVGASCRGADVDLAKAAASPECAIDAAVAKRIWDKKSKLKLTLSASPTRLRYGDAITISLTATNTTSAEVPLAITIDEAGEIGFVTIETLASSRLPENPVAPPKQAQRFVGIALSRGGAARFRIDTRLRAMKPSFDMSCTRADCPRYVEVTWDPGASFPPGKHRLRPFVDGIESDSGWTLDVDVTR